MYYMLSTDNSMTMIMFILMIHMSTLTIITDMTTTMRTILICRPV